MSIETKYSQRTVRNKLLKNRITLIKLLENLFVLRYLIFFFRDLIITFMYWHFRSFDPSYRQGVRLSVAAIHSLRINHSLNLQYFGLNSVYTFWGGKRHLWRETLRCCTCFIAAGFFFGSSSFGEVQKSLIAPSRRSRTYIRRWQIYLSCFK